MSAIDTSPSQPNTSALDRRQRTAYLVGRGMWYILLLLAFFLALASLLPLYWMITGSFKVQHDSIAYPPDMFPTNPTLENWENLLFGTKSVEELFNPDLAVAIENWKELMTKGGTVRWLVNSIIVAGSIALISVITSTLAGYAFGKKEFPGRNVLFWLLLMTMMLPRQLSLIPLFIMMKDLKWFDTYQAMIAPYICYPFGIFLIRQFMQAVPNELLDAAKIDGASELQLFWKVVFPLVKPAVGAVAIFAFMFGWNDYLWQLVVINKDSMVTLPVGVSRLVAGWGSVDIGVGMAGATLAFIPMLIVFLLFQDYFVKGITLGALKG